MTTGAATGASLVWNGSAWVPGSAANVPGVLYTASKLLTSANLLAIATTGINLVAAPGSGFALVPINWIANYTFVTTQYTDHAGALILQWGTTGGLQVGSGGITTAGLWDQTHSTYVQAGGLTRGAANVSTQIGNQPLAIQQNTASPTGGNGTLTATISYYVVAVA